MAVAMMQLDDRVLHLPSMEHGIAHCGQVMRDPWCAGPTAVLDEKAVEWCEECFDAMPVR